MTELELEPDPGCLRGLKFKLRLPSPVPEQDRVRAALIHAFPEATVGVERWAARRVDRLIVQFRVELRLGERDGELVVMFRSCCPEPERGQLRARLLASVAAAYAAPR